MKELQIYEIKKPGFHQAVIFESWKVSVFNSAPIWKEENISYLQKHIFSDEVFVLLYGECILLLSGEEEPGNIYGVKLEKGKVYNVPKGMWHSHVLGDNTKILVVENQDTVPENAPKIPFPCRLELKTLEYRDR